MMADPTHREIKWFTSIFFLGVIFLPNLFPLYQLFVTKGYLFYQNAFDEYSYLSFEAASQKTGILRFSRYLIRWLHEIGFSSGYINFVFDLVCPAVIIYFIFKMFSLLGFDKNKSLLAAALIIVFPVLIGGSNPVYSKLFHLTLSSGWVYWLVIPEAYYPPFYRTPEPQLSYLLMVLAVYISIKRKSFIPLYFVAPFLYGFLRVPYLFIVLSCHLSKINKKHNFVRIKYASWFIGFFSYVLVSAMVGLYYEISLKDILKPAFLPATRLPLLSGTFVLCLLVWKILPRHSAWKNSEFIGFVVAAPLAAANCQVISGFISQPINFEQGFGVVCLSFLATIFILSLKKQKWIIPALSISTMLLSLIYSFQIFRVNSNPILLQEPPRELIEALREDPFNVVFEDSRLGSTMSMVLPRQSFTGLAISQSYGFGAPKYFNKYVCLKEKIKQEPGKFEKYKSALMNLDKGYTHLHTDFIFIHLNRRKDFPVFFDVHKKPGNCGPKKLYYYP
jgi:hypothetical protein